MSDRIAMSRNDDVIIRFVQDGPEFLPVVRDQYGNEKTVVWAPLPGSQRLFLDAPEFEAIYEGTRGPGKTTTLLMDFAQEVGKGWGAEWKGMIIRQTYPQLNDVITMSKKWFKRIWPGAFYNEIKYFWQWPTGELLFFRPIEVEADYWQHHGTNYTWLGWEELTTWADDAAYKKMFSVVRSTMKNIPLRIRATTNPYGVGHNWVQARFNLVNWPIKVGQDKKGDIFKIVGPLIKGSVDERGIPEPPRRAYHGTLRENLVLMHVQPQYIQQIKSAARNKSELEAWLYGSWDIAAGGMLDDIWHTHKDRFIVGDFDPPQSWKITRAYDHGSSKPWSCGYYAESDGSDISWKDEMGKTVTRSTLRGDLFRVGEIYGWQKDQPNVGKRETVPEIKKQIITYELRRGWRDASTGKSRVHRGPADTSIFDDVNGVCVSNDFEDPIVIEGHRFRGIVWEKADKGPNSRVQGWEQLRQWLKATKPEPGHIREHPGLFIVGPRCPHALRTLPVLKRDEKHIDDVDTDCEDHVGDEIRYRLRFENRTIKTRRA